MQDLLFAPANEWHDYRGCRLLRSRAVFAARQEFVFVDHPCVEEVRLIDMAAKVDEPHPITTHDALETATEEPPMVAGYIILSKRTTLAVFRSILPDTTRFFFLSAPLLRFLRQHPSPVAAIPVWCDKVLSDTRALIEDCRQPVTPSVINKPPPDCAQPMSGFYTGIACLVLFDARGSIEQACAAWGPSVYIYFTVCLSTLLLSLKYLPAILHRPQQLVDALCNDLLCITAHAAAIATVVEPCLRHGCALHSACFIVQQRFIGKMPLFANTGIAHTSLILTLLAAYVYGPRISEVKPFMLSAVCPHALELLAQLFAHLHRLAVMSWCEATGPM